MGDQFREVDDNPTIQAIREAGLDMVNKFNDFIKMCQEDQKAKDCFPKETKDVAVKADELNNLKKQLDDLIDSLEKMSKTSKAALENVKNN